MQKLGYLGGKKLGQPILSPPQLVKVSTLPCREYANNLCFLGGGEKLGWPILSSPRQDKASTLCRWLSGSRKTRLVHYFPTLTSESINLTLSWIHIQPLLFRGWGKTGPAHSLPTLPSESINFVQKLGRPSFSPLTKKQRLHMYSWQGMVGCVFIRRRLTICTTVFPHAITFWTRLIFNLVGVGKEWAGPVFPHPLTSDFRFYAYSWQGKVG